MNLFSTLMNYKGLLAITDENLASKKIADTLFNTVTAMASRLARYNHTDTNILVSMIADRMFNRIYIGT